MIGSSYDKIEVYKSEAANSSEAKLKDKAEALDGEKIGGVTEGTTQAGESSIKNIYDSIKKAPQYPEGFKNVANGTRKVNIKKGDVLDELRKVESGQWKKIYKDGYDANGKKISIHYFQSQSGKVFNVKVKSGWSNK